MIANVRRLNKEKGYSVAIMMDTEGAEIHMGDLGGAASAKAEVQPICLSPLELHALSCTGCWPDMINCPFWSI